ncbi:hypothetical protein [Staphylococcus equorum]|uniref:hypothetical protein n=1 Tax=Staphylococcus equorum TaxID=246432 RepID=UPI003D662EDB
MSEYKQVIQNLLDSNIKGYLIQKETGVSRSRISDLRNGIRPLGGISLDTAEKLYKYAIKPYNVEVQFDNYGAGTDLDSILEVMIVYEDGKNFTIDELVNETPEQGENRTEFVEKKLIELGYSNFIEIKMV